MEVIPSIDLRAGKVVHLHQGDYALETVYSEDPLAVAKGFAEAKPARIHVVDLDGAWAGSPQHLDTLGALVAGVGIPIQYGGGLRTIRSVKEVLNLGVERVVLGTAAIEDPGMVRQAVAAFGADRIVVGLDARDGTVAIKGWRESGNVSSAELLALMAQMGVGRFVYTDISRDGTLTSPNFEAVAAILRHAHDLLVAGDWQHEVKIVASGGVSRMEHLERLAVLGAEGAIVGSALYQSKIDLQTAVTVVTEP